MKAVRMVVDGGVLAGVKLNHRLIIGPENIFHLAHFIPRGATIRKGHADVLPALILRVVFAVAAAYDSEFPNHEDPMVGSVLDLRDSGI
jgi:hypothetical protein